jgi:hypothetical protein
VAARSQRIRRFGKANPSKRVNAPKLLSPRAETRELVEGYRRHVKAGTAPEHVAEVDTR